MKAQYIQCQQHEHGIGHKKILMPDSCRTYKYKTYTYRPHHSCIPMACQPLLALQQYFTIRLANFVVLFPHRLIAANFDTI